MQQRREFMKTLAVSAGAVLAANHALAAQVKTDGSDKLGPILPTRPFGKTGESLTIYCMGGSHVNKATDEKESQAIIEKAIEMGVRTFDCAWTYGNGRAEELYGKYLIPKYRDHIFLYTKTKSFKPEETRKQLEDSLRRMNTDTLDLWLMHTLTTDKDVDERLDAGVLEVMLEAQQKGIVRHLGFSGHQRSSAHRRLIKRVAGKDPFVACQLPVNVVDAVKRDSFVLDLVPDLVEHGYAIFAMKTLAHGRFFKNNMDKFETNDPVIPDNISLEEALWFVLSQPVTSIVVGTDKLEQVSRNIDVVKRFTELSNDDQIEITKKVAKFAGTPKLEYYRPAPGTY